MVLGGQQRLGGRDRTQSPVRSAAACAFFEPGERRGGRFPVADMRGGFDEFEETPAVEAKVLVFATFAGSGERLVVPSDTVEQDRGGVSGEADEAAFTPWRFRPRRRIRSIRMRRREPLARRQVSTSGISPERGRSTR